jgi:hypothetical protein
MARSVEREDWIGNKYTEHFDDDGNKTGESRDREDWIGNKYNEHTGYGARPSDRPNGKSGADSTNRAGAAEHPSYDTSSYTGSDHSSSASTHKSRFIPSVLVVALILGLVAYMFDSPGKDSKSRIAEKKAVGEKTQVNHARLNPLWFGKWKNRAKNKTITFSESTYSVEEERIDAGKLEQVRYEHTWLDKTDGVVEPGRFGYSKKVTAPSEIATRLDTAIVQYVRDSAFFSVSEPTASRNAIFSISTGRYKVVWSYAGGDCAIWEYIVDGDRMLEVSDCKYNFSVDLFNRVR